MCIGTKVKICLMHSNNRKKSNVAGMGQREMGRERGREREICKIYKYEYQGSETRLGWDFVDEAGFEIWCCIEWYP